MIKRVILSMLMMMTAFSCLSFARVTDYRVRFTITTPFVVGKDPKGALPPGEYWIKDINSASQHAYSLQRGKERKHIGWVTMVSLTTDPNIEWRSKTNLEFDLETEYNLPKLHKIYLEGEKGYEVLDARFEKSAGLIEIASFQRKQTVIEHNLEHTLVRQKNLPQTTTSIEKVPQSAESDLKLDTVVESNREIPEPERKVIQPIKERKRLLKD
jgi:hypothetical protein